MAALPDLLERREHVDLARRNAGLWFRRVVLAAFVGLAIAGLANVFGQQTRRTATTAPGAELDVEAPAALRLGLVYQATITIRSRPGLERPALVLDPGWFDGLTLNSLQPEPADWAQRDGREVLSFDAIDPGEKLVVRLEFQVNPTAAGTRTQNVSLEDRGRPVAFLPHSVTIFP